jgi:hypothetical protein
MSLALLVIAVIDSGHLHADCSGATPTTSGLVRLGRDLMRRAGLEASADAAGFVGNPLRNRRSRAPTVEASS